VIATWIDPLGRTVVLYADSWYGHVCVEHPNLHDQIHLAQTAIDHPEHIRLDASFAERESYYRPVWLAKRRTLLKVSIEFDAPDEYDQIVGTVVTAFPTTIVKQGESRRWPERLKSGTYPGS
jgi:hypothetical protein